MTKADLFQVLAGDNGVILRRDHPELVEDLKRQTALGAVISVLPGVFVPTGTALDPMVRMRAAARWDRDAVFTGAAAARLSYWPEVNLNTISLAVRHERRPQRGFSFARRRIKPELVSQHHGLRFTCPALTALDLADLDHSDAIDIALRTRATTLEAMHEVL
ncbi:MAG TPA: hypothetical protein VF635_13910, partial [Propionibacteriaceae bacterium]